MHIPKALEFIQNHVWVESSVIFKGTGVWPFDNLLRSSNPTWQNSLKKISNDMFVLFFFNPLVFVTTLSFLKRLLFLSAIAFNSQEMHHRSYSCCHHAFFPDTCVICGAYSDCVPHLFLHCSAAVSLWHSLFGIFGEHWCFPVPGPNLDE